MVVDCFRGTIFNWCDAVLAYVKGQLTRAKNGKLKNFGYGYLVVNFSLERVPILVPQQLTLRLDFPEIPELCDGLQYWPAILRRVPRLFDSQ